MDKINLQTIAVYITRIIRYSLSTVGIYTFCAQKHRAQRAIETVLPHGPSSNSPFGCNNGGNLVSHFVLSKSVLPYVTSEEAIKSIKM